MKASAFVVLLFVALESVRGDGLLESVPGVGNVVAEATDAIGEDVSDVATNITTEITDGYKKTRLFLITATKNATFDLDHATSLLTDAAFNKALPTVVYMHGYEESKESESVSIVSGAFLLKGSHNFVLVDWSEYAKPPYITAFFHVPGVSAVLGDALDRLVKAGLSRDGLWLIGHSMGGQMSGIVSRSLDFLPKRISALDPALPGYQLPGFANLTRDDAALVDVIHTDAGVFGFNEACGHLDFWPNGGRPLQPGCTVLSGLFCSHHRSWWFFAESVNNETAFPAVRCSSWDDFKKGECAVNDTNVAYLGYQHPGSQVLEGDYFLTTNDASPFSRGLDGVTEEVHETNAVSGFFGDIADKTQDFFGRVFPFL